MANEQPNRNFQYLDETPFSATAKPWNGDAVCVQLRDGFIYDARFVEAEATDPGADLSLPPTRGQPPGQWIFADGQPIPEDNPPLLWSEELWPE